MRYHNNNTPSILHTCLQHPTAHTREIKQAYYNLMREHHPDQATNDGFDSNAFCALLNQIYQVLVAAAAAG